MTDKLQFYTPVGRFVSGSMTEKRDKDIQNRPLDPDKQRYEFGLAIRKDDPGLMPLLTQINQYALGAYAHAPAVQHRINGWMQTMSGFSMKISDGDKPNAKGHVNQNTAGHFVFWFSTALDIKACDTANQEIDLQSVKRGYHVIVSGTCVVNGLLDDNAGIYMNPSWVMLHSEGDEIQGGISAEDAFAGMTVPTTLPPGARPLGSNAGVPGGMTPGANPTMPGAVTSPPTSAPPVTGGALPDVATPGTTTASPGETHPPHPDILGAGGLPGQ